MTICIAAICDAGKRIVLAADRMFTAPPPVNMQFVTEEQKIEDLASNCIALLSGNSGYGSEILDLAREQIGGDRTPVIEKVSEFVKAAYSSVRAQKAEETIINPTLGPDFSAFQKKGGTIPAYLQVQPGVYQQLIMTLNQFNINVEILISGIDSTGARIALVTHPGTLVWLDKLGYHAIGSGGIHALTRLNLSAQMRHRTLIETLCAVYDAKIAAEVAPGVGRETDLAIVDAENGVSRCSIRVLGALQTVHEKAATHVHPDLSALEGALREESQ